MTAALALAPLHEIIVPIVLPLMLGAVLVLLERRGSRWVAPLSVAGTLLLLATSAYLLVLAHGLNRPLPYLVGNWVAPYGIVLVLDRLAALMVLLTAIVATVALVYALGGDAKRGPHFHSLIQFQLMGLNGAFLTGDLFNLFVFFEVLLIASYGLLLHGAGPARLRASVHYVVFNLTGSALFLIAVSLLYGLTGTLNMADMAERLAKLPADRTLLAQSAALLLVVVFGVKAALLPLFFWLPATYGAASSPVAALFAIMTKVGVYAILRCTTLVFGVSPGTGSATTLVAAPWLQVLALATLALGAVGALAARQLRAQVGNLVVASAGMLLLAVALAQPGTVAAGLFYLVHSTLAVAALFLLADRLRHARARQAAQHGAPAPGPARGLHDGSHDGLQGGIHNGSHGGSHDGLHAAPLGAARVRLGVVFFVLAVAVAGLPPGAGFLGKALLLQAAGPLAWGGVTVSVVLGSSLLVMVALARSGSSLFWKPAPEAAGAPAALAATTAAGAAVITAAAAVRAKPAAPAAGAAIATENHGSAQAQAAVPTQPSHRLALGVLLVLVLGCSVFAGPLSRFSQATAAQLFTPHLYRQAVLAARPAPPAWDVRREMRERKAAAERSDTPAPGAKP